MTNDEEVTPSPLPTNRLLRFFTYSHLPPKLQPVSEPLCTLAIQMDALLPDGPEKTAGMRKLLEAKDCFVRAVLFVLLLVCMLPAQMATSVERHGIRWTFAHPTEVGTFANGDWFVVGECSIASVSPSPDIVAGRWVNGSMVNPSFMTDQGYDSGGQYLSWDPLYTIGFPHTITPGDSLVSTESNTGTSPLIKSAAVLTCLAARPATTCFRPPYAGTNKPLYPTSLMRPDNLVRVTLASFAVAAPPVEWGDYPTRLDALTARFERLWLEGSSGWAGEYLHPSDTQPMYYRDFSTLAGSMWLALAADVDVSTKLAGAVAMIQWGIDARWNVTAGWYGDGGGHGTGRKAPIVFAGLMGIDDCQDVNAACVTHPHWNHRDHRAVFQDDGQTWIVTEADIGRVLNPGNAGYTTAHVGMPEWGNMHYEWPNNDNSSWDGNAYRLCCHNNAWHGQFLVLRAMGGLKSWNWNPCFLYHDRYVSTVTSNNSPGFVKGWDLPQYDEFVRLRQSDLPGVVTIGVPHPTAPKLNAATPPRYGESWQVEIDAGKTQALTGILTRSTGTALRPSRTWGPFAAQGLVFVNAEDLEVSVLFTTAANGKVTVTIPPADDHLGDTFTLQAVIVEATGLVPTNAAEVTIR